VLPLVEFELEPGISDAEAQALLGEDVLGAVRGAGGERGVELAYGESGVAEGTNVLRLDDDDGGGGDQGRDLGALLPRNGKSGVLDDPFNNQVRMAAIRARSMCSSVFSRSVHWIMHGITVRLKCHTMNTA
jgi:hypothetical protein